jgi:tRNA dimethylallyltransferase
MQAVIIAGPTASGKTHLSMMLAQHISIEIINADIGQFYTPCSIGTAKPDWRNHKIPHHLFDILDVPQDLSASQYHQRVVETVKEIEKRGNLPVIVGGSLFYIKSLFFPPKTLPQLETVIDYECNGTSAWEQLFSIDPVRAAVLHPHDIYRVNRALHIWKTTGMKPSELQPTFSAPFSCLFLFLQLDKQILHQRIDQRTDEMITSKGWIDEVRLLQRTDWEPFLKKKKLIGYPEIFSWLSADTDERSVNHLIETIQRSTRSYSKRQQTFWRSFKKLLGAQDVRNECKVVEVSVYDGSADAEIVKRVCSRICMRPKRRGRKQKKVA